MIDNAPTAFEVRVSRARNPSFNPAAAHSWARNPLTHTIYYPSPVRAGTVELGVGQIGLRPDMALMAAADLDLAGYGARDKTVRSWAGRVRFPPQSLKEHTG